MRDDFKPRVALQIQQQSLALVSSGAPLSAQLPEGGSLNVGGIPRVPSLDLLRQLVAQQQQGQNGAAKAPTSMPIKEGKLDRSYPFEAHLLQNLCTCSLQSAMRA